MLAQSNIQPRDKSSGGTAGFIKFTYPQASGTGKDQLSIMIIITNQWSTGNRTRQSGIEFLIVSVFVHYATRSHFIS